MENYHEIALFNRLFIKRKLPILPGPPVAQTVKNLAAVREAQFDPWVGIDHLEDEMATHSSILAWRIPWTEEPGGLQSIGLQRVRHHSSTTKRLTLSLYQFY